MKIDWVTAASRDPRLSLEYEFSLLETLEGRALHLNPSYQVIDGKWYVLGMDWVEGEHLDELIREGHVRKVSILELIGRVFRVSLAGVIYKQLRARHTIQRANGELVFIDFGGSSHANPLVAIWRNFAPLSSLSGSWQASRLLELLRVILRGRYSAMRSAPRLQQSRSSASPAALQRWQANSHRDPQSRPACLAHKPCDPIAARHFAEMERCLDEAVQIEPRICSDLYRFFFADYFLSGNRDWGIIWDRITRRVDFAGKNIIDLGCGMGTIGAFTRIAGGAHVTSLDSLPPLLDAARHFATAFGILDNTYRAIDWEKLTNGSESLPKADIISALSLRLGDQPLERVLDILAQYPEILWQTTDAEAGRRGLEARGYRTVEILGRSEFGKFILYAADREK
jgi:hypothetical protein